MEEKKKRRIVIGTLISVLIFLSFVFFKAFSITTQSVVSYPITFFKNFLSLSMSLGTSEAMTSSLFNPIIFIIPFIPMALGFAFLTFYGVTFGEDIKLGFFSCLIPSIIGAIYLGPSPTIIFLAIGLMICGVISTQLAAVYSEELKKWKNYRIGSKTVGKLFLIINLMLFFALLLDVTINIENYNSLYTNETKELVISIIPDIESGESLQIGSEMLPAEQQEEIASEFANMTEAQRDIINSKINEIFASKKISAMINFSIFLLPFMVFALLELLRLIILSPISGLVTKAFVKTK